MSKTEKHDLTLTTTGSSCSSDFSPVEDLKAQCSCPASKLFRHRKLKCAARLMAPGLNVRNETDVPILFVLSQLTPLHWGKIMPHDSRHIDCGRVFFTVSTEIFDPKTEPTAAGVAARLATITAVSVFSGVLLGVAVVGG